MPNLLTYEEKKKISHEFITRLVVVFLFFSFVSILISILALVPSYVLSSVKEDSAKNDNETLNKAIAFREENTPLDILEMEKSKLQALSGEDKKNINNIIFDILGDKPESIKITGFFYDRQEEGGEGSSVVIRGNADDRNILVDFVDSLEDKGNFSKVDFPVSNLLKGESVDFSVKIYLK